jgi:hypothetical protein
METIFIKNFCDLTPTNELSLSIDEQLTILWIESTVDSQHVRHARQVRWHFMIYLAEVKVSYYGSR